MGKKLSVVLLLLLMLLPSCYRDDIDALRRELNNLKQEQINQADLIKSMQALQNAQNSKVQIVSLEKSATVPSLLIAKLSNNTQLGIVNGGVTSFSKDATGKVVVDGTVTDIDWKNEWLELSISAGGMWVIDGVESDVKAPSISSKLVDVVKSGENIEFIFSDGTTFVLRHRLPSGFYLLSEGAWGQGNGELSYFSYDMNTDTYLFDKASRKMDFGETPNAVIQYGSKMYVVCTGVKGGNNGVVKVLDMKGNTEKTISLKVEEGALMPRFIVSYGGAVYVSNYLDADNKPYSYVSKIDTLTFEPSYAKVDGFMSEEMAIVGDELFVCQSGQGADNKIVVVGLQDFKQKEVITVAYNPVNIVSDDNGMLYFSTWQPYSGPDAGTPSNLYQMDAKTRKVTRTFDIRVGGLSRAGDYLYVTDIDWGTMESTIKRVSLRNGAVSDFTSELPSYMLPKKAFYEPQRGEVFFTQMSGAFIYRFTEDGKLIERLRAKQQNGSGIIFTSTVI